MALNFPSAPTVGQLYPDPLQPGVPQYRWDGTVWVASPQDALLFVKRAGDTMTGHLALPTAPADANAVRKDYVDTAAATKVAKAGDTMTGVLTLAYAQPSVALQKTASGQHNQIVGYNGVTARWLLSVGDSAAETGANAGSDFSLYNYADNGTFIGAALTINRATGLMYLKGDPTAPLGVATKQYVDGKVASIAGYLPIAGGSMTGVINTGGGVYTTMGYGGMAGSIQVMGPGGAADAMISFHRPGAFGLNFGLDASTHLVYGGWSHGGSVFTLWSTAYFGYPVSTGRMAFAGDYTDLGQGMAEPYGGAVITGQDTYYHSMRFRYMQMYSSGWFTCGYA